METITDLQRELMLIASDKNSSELLKDTAIVIHHKVEQFYNNLSYYDFISLVNNQPDLKESEREKLFDLWDHDINFCSDCVQLLGYGELPLDHERQDIESEIEKNWPNHKLYPEYDDDSNCGDFLPCDCCDNPCTGDTLPGKAVIKSLKSDIKFVELPKSTEFDVRFEQVRFVCENGITKRD